MEQVIDSCRMCLENQGEFISLECDFDSSKSSTSYFDVYNFCTNLNADVNDQFPSIICNKCASNLTLVYEVIQKAIHSDQVLREIMEKQQVLFERMSPSDQKYFEEDEILIEDEIEETSDHLYEDYSMVEEDNDAYQEFDVEECVEENPMEESAFTVKSEDEDNLKVIDGIDLACELCHEAFATVKELSLHYMEHYDKEEEILLSKDSLQENLLSISSEESPKKKYTKKSQSKNWVCEICGKFFTTKQKLTTHNLVHTKEKKFACSLCPKRHATIFRHRDHMKTHENIRNHECNVCKQRFFSKSTLKCHLRRHTGERPYKCEICGKAFTQASIMKTHTALHTGKTVECNLCSKKFTRPSHLILHRRSHTGERPYLCTLCPNSYRQKSHLDRHLDTHMGVKHTCEVCGKSYTKKSSLTSHMYVHLSTKRFKCVELECKLEFATKDGYKRHLKSVHQTATSDENPAKASAVQTEITQQTLLESES